MAERPSYFPTPTMKLPNGAVRPAWFDAASAGYDQYLGKFAAPAEGQGLDAIPFWHWLKSTLVGGSEKDQPMGGFHNADGSPMSFSQYKQKATDAGLGSVKDAPMRSHVEAARVWDPKWKPGVVMKGPVPERPAPAASSPGVTPDVVLNDGPSVPPPPAAAPAPAGHAKPGWVKGPDGKWMQRPAGRWASWDSAKPSPRPKPARPAAAPAAAPALQKGDEGWVHPDAKYWNLSNFVGKPGYPSGRPGIPDYTPDRPPKPRPGSRPPMKGQPGFDAGYRPRPKRRR
jgi:hypothetical protein